MLLDKASPRLGAVRPAAATRLARLPSRACSRRSFLAWVLHGLWMPVLWLARRSAERTAALPELANPVVTIPCTTEPGIRFYDKVILSGTTDGLSVFSSSCPHLGCRLDRAEEGQIICPCHGSRFDERGQLVQGPAATGLFPLRYDRDRKSGLLRVFLTKT